LLTLACMFRTLETVWWETPAKLATSAMDGLRSLRRPGDEASLAPTGAPGGSAPPGEATSADVVEPASIFQSHALAAARLRALTSETWLITPMR
jgi:hypothetical protein